MIILKITSEKQHLNKITLENGEELLIDKDICIQHSLMAKTEIEPEEITALKRESDFSRAKSRALWYLDRQDYTEKKLYGKLVEKGFDKKVCAAVIAKLVEIGAIDDRRYAERYAERLLEARTSKREAMQKMLLRGVPYDLGKQVLSEFQVDEEEQLTELIEKKYTDKLQTENGYQKVYAALARKGFSFTAIKAALKKYIEDIEFSEEY